MEQVCGLEYEASGNGEAVLFIHGAILSDTFAPLVSEESLAGFRCIGTAGVAMGTASASLANRRSRDTPRMRCHFSMRSAHRLPMSSLTRAVDPSRCRWQ